MKTSKVNQVASFEKLVSICNAHGAVYNPSKASIKAAALTTLLTQAQQSLQAADVARTTYENAVNARQQIFVTVPKLATRIIGALVSSGATPEIIQDARLVRRRFNASPKKQVGVQTDTLPDTGEAETADAGGLSQRDYATMADNFARLVNRVTVEPLYKPNEADLQAAALATFVTTLRDRNKAVVNALVALSNARIARNKVLYQANGVYDTGKTTKEYIKSVFGLGSEQYRQVSKLQFRKAA